MPTAFCFFLHPFTDPPTEAPEGTPIRVLMRLEGEPGTPAAGIIGDVARDVEPGGELFGLDYAAWAGAARTSGQVELSTFGDRSNVTADTFQPE